MTTLQLMITFLLIEIAPFLKMGAKNAIGFYTYSEQQKRDTVLIQYPYLLLSDIQFSQIALSVTVCKALILLVSSYHPYRIPAKARNSKLITSSTRRDSNNPSPIKPSNKGVPMNLIAYGLTHGLIHYYSTIPIERRVLPHLPFMD